MIEARSASAGSVAVVLVVHLVEQAPLSDDAPTVCDLGGAVAGHLWTEGRGGGLCIKTPARWTVLRTAICTAKHESNFRMVGDFGVGSCIMVSNGCANGGVRWR